jgi:2-phosphosulfolactate phosphatase
MRLHVAFGPSEFGALELGGRSAVVVDVLRATTTVVAAFEAGCRRIVPVADPDAARREAAALPAGECLVAGEEQGDPIPGFDLGNSPLEYAAERVRGRTIVLTTTNGTRAMIAARAAAAATVAALSNLDAAAAWCLAAGRDVTVLCAGEKGEFSLEDAVGAGLLVERVAAGAGSAELSDAAVAARLLGERYAPCLDRLRADARWARRLVAKGRGADVDVCLRLGRSAVAPALVGGALEAGRGALAGEAAR